MQIEFISCTGAGKSTLAERVVRANEEQKHAPRLSRDFVLQRMRLAWIANRWLRVSALNIVALGMCLLAWRKYRIFLNFTMRCIRQLHVNVSLLGRLKIVRIALRNVGVHEFVERYAAHDDVVIADEGMLQIAHYLFVHIAAEPRVELIEAFAKLVPLPGVVVYMRQPEALLIERTLQRGHKRIPKGSTELVKRFITRATTMFEILIQQPAIRSRLLVIDPEQQLSPAACADTGPLLDRVCDLIRPALSPAEQTIIACSVGNQP